MKKEMFAILKDAMNLEYKEMLPPTYKIHILDEYDPAIYTAPNLWLEKREKPKAKYIAILLGARASVPALGETTSEAVAAAILKIEKLNLYAEDKNNGSD